MSNLFSLNTILSESSIFDNMIKSPIEETYLHTSLSTLDKLNTGISESTKQMYQKIAESTSRAEENQQFAEYFKNYKSLISDYRRQMQELVSKFAININT